MNHYCTYFDSGFLVQGVALWRSIQQVDPGSILWILALDERAAGLLRQLGEEGLRVVEIASLEACDRELANAKETRSRVEYYFTLSPCWPRWILAENPGVDRVTYIDADMWFFSSPKPYFAEMDDARASVMISAHRFPTWLTHYERHGRYNVGILSFRNDNIGRGCLDTWRLECLEWCYDRLEGDRYADQKYLDRWPARLGAALKVCANPGVNLAPWNWNSQPIRVDPIVTADDMPLIIFHFARFRPISGHWLWQSGQLDYGVMPGRLRQAIYGPYWASLCRALAEIRNIEPRHDFPHRPARLSRDLLRALPLRLLFGTDWIRVGSNFYSARFGIGRYSGRFLACARHFFRK